MTHAVRSSQRGLCLAATGMALLFAATLLVGCEHSRETVQNTGEATEGSGDDREPRRERAERAERGERGERGERAEREPEVRRQAKIELADPIIAGEAVVDAAALKTNLEEKARAIRRCYHEGVEEDNELAGVVRLHFGVNAEGAIEAPTLLQNDLGDDVGACIDTAVAEWTFDPTEDGLAYTVDQTFTLSTEEVEARASRSGQRQRGAEGARPGGQGRRGAQGQAQRGGGQPQRGARGGAGQARAGGPGQPGGQGNRAGAAGQRQGRNQGARGGQRPGGRPAGPPGGGGR